MSLLSGQKKLGGLESTLRIVPVEDGELGGCGGCNCVVVGKIVGSGTTVGVGAGVGSEVVIGREDIVVVGFFLFACLIVMYVDCVVKEKYSI